MTEPPGPMRQVQIAHIATEYYVHGKTRIEIAEQTGLSRFKVGRLLDEAVESGIVRFEISSPSNVSLDLSVRLRERFGLDHAVVVAIPTDSEVTVQEALGATTADLLGEVLADDDILGLTSGRTLNAMARSLTSLRCHNVVQLAGVAGPIQQSGLEVMRRVSMLDGVRPWPIYASLLMSDAQAAEGVRRQPDIRQTFDQFSRVTVAVGAIGSWVPRNSLMYENRALNDADRRRILDRGVVAEIAATLVTDSGEVVHDLDSRSIAVSEKQLRAIPTRIGAAGGPTKVRAIRAVLTAKLLTGLVTDSETAQQLLAG
ncbi:sugar-binding domain-containing protein [Sinomonas sp. ASV322]|uniref:sugar-binding transcriptional regulator n=1 Tax=Sinomonas sp. ASV322 TaxID=3041920 RepID=UPI0027DBDF56|nr:sugar-binding domain-containing protein [Sinomonas sp. ASV322]MDQ4504020.1 sugar-binding domain-containing protein [Sinomonas sp. ASV322]